MTTVYPAVTSDGTVTSFVPLTTPFTAPTECSDYFRLNGPSLVAFDPGYGLDIDTDVRCVPSAVTTWWEQGRLGVNGDGHTAISIGPLVCPYEWQTVVTSVENESSTLAMCCPSGYYLANGIPGSIVGDCVSDVSVDMLLTYASTQTDNSDLWYTETTTLIDSSIVGAIAIVGWNIELAAPTKVETASSLATITSSAPSTSDSIPVTSSLPSPSNNSSQISSGAAIGVGVGVGLGVIGSASLLVAICLMRRRRRRNLAQTRQDYAVMPTQQPPRAPSGEAPGKHELHDERTGRHELHANIQNLSGQHQGPHPLAELPE